MSRTRKSKKFSITKKSNTMSRTGRPMFISSTKRELVVMKGQDRRHILHGATHISDVLIDSFNRIISKHGIIYLKKLVDNLLARLKDRGVRFIINSSLLTEKIKKLITIAFSKKKNLVVGDAIANQGIEKARNSISIIRKKLGEQCKDDVFGFNEIKAKLLKLINESISSSKSTGKVAKYRKWIIELLKSSVNEATNTVQLIRLLSHFEFSCSLDIVHAGCSKEQNIWGITMFNKLQRAIEMHDENEILRILI